MLHVNIAYLCGVDGETRQCGCLLTSPGQRHRSGDRYKAPRRGRQRDLEPPALAGWPSAFTYRAACSVA